MPTYLTPGVYFERPDPQLAPFPQRTDIVGFVGVAQRGPLHTPQRLTSWRQFQQEFGSFLPYAYLAYAVHAFFENGGRVCWVVRIAHREATQVASVTIPEYRDNPDPISRPDRPTAYVAEAIHPGTWGNDLAVSIQFASLAASHHIVLDNLSPHYLAVASIARFEPGSQVRLTQQGRSSSLLRVDRVDAVRGILSFNAPLTGVDVSDRNHPISVESLEFSLLVWQADQTIERFDALSPDAAHSRYAIDQVNTHSRLIRLHRGDGDARPQLPWRSPLTGGANGLRTLNLFDYIGSPQGEALGLTTLADIDEVSLLAVPDLVGRSQPPAPLQRVPRRSIPPCGLDTPTRRTTVTGKVIDAETDDALPQVKVEANDGIQQQETLTDIDGNFTLSNLLLGEVSLVLRRIGYEDVAIRIIVNGVGSQSLNEIQLTPLDVPTALNHEDIYAGQSAMIAQCQQLRDRFAILDPPLTDNGLLDLSGLQSWRARFDTPFAALYYPWLRISDPLQLDAAEGRLVPPSGHVAGLYAAVDLTEGVFRAPANRALNWINDVGTIVDDGLQGILNPQGINAIRAFPGRGIRVFGSRTLSSDRAWQFVNVRRLLIMIEEAIADGLQWGVFEPNDVRLWAGLRLSLTTLLDGLWRRGALVGDTPDAAYQVRCDATTTPPDLQAAGRVVAEVRVAPTVPYEFIVLRLGMTVDELQISELQIAEV